MFCSLLPSSPAEVTRLSSNGDQAVSSTGPVWPLASGRMSGSFCGKPAGEGGVKGEYVGRIANAYRHLCNPSGHVRAHSSARDLPVHGNVLSSGSDEVGVPCGA